MLAAPIGIEPNAFPAGKVCLRIRAVHCAARPVLMWHSLTAEFNVYFVFARSLVVPLLHVPAREHVPTIPCLALGPFQALLGRLIYRLQWMAGLTLPMVIRGIGVCISLSTPPTKRARLWVVRSCDDAPLMLLLSLLLPLRCTQDRLGHHCCGRSREVTTKVLASRVGSVDFAATRTAGTCLTTHCSCCSRRRAAIA